MTEEVGGDEELVMERGRMEIADGREPRYGQGRDRGLARCRRGRRGANTAVRVGVGWT